MTTENVIYLEFDDAFWLHLDLMKDWKETRYGLDHRSLVESALARPKPAAVYENADIIRQAATLCFGLIKNHPWLGGNKRTATHLTEVFLGINGFSLEYEISAMLELASFSRTSYLDELKAENLNSIEEVAKFEREQTKNIERLKSEVSD